MILRGLRGKIRRWAYLQTARIQNFLSAKASDENLIVKDLLVIHMQAAGDMLLAIPALSALARRGVRLHMLTSPAAAVFLKELPFLASLDTDEKDALKRSYDAAVDFQDTFTTWHRALLLSKVDAKRRTGLMRGFMPWGTHTHVQKDMGHIHDHC